MACGFHPERQETARNMWVRSPWGPRGWGPLVGRSGVGSAMGFTWTARSGVTSRASGTMESVDTAISSASSCPVQHTTTSRAISWSNGFATWLRYARVRLGRFGAEDLAQDVAQEVCMAVVAAVPTYEERGLPFEAFVYRIASHKLADVQRAEMRGPMPVADLPDRVDEAPTPEQAAVVRDDAALALSCCRSCRKRNARSSSSELPWACRPRRLPLRSV